MSAGALPISKLDDDAFTRVRVILMNGIETEANFFQHNCARMNRDLQLPLAKVRYIEHLQQTLVNTATTKTWMLILGCSPQCFAQHRGDIDRVVNSWIVKARKS